MQGPAGGRDTAKRSEGRTNFQQQLHPHLLDYLVVGLFRRPVTVEEPGPGVHPQVDGQGTGVLCQEHRRPTDLETTILKVKELVRKYYK